jgi:hypothetical protein
MTAENPRGQETYWFEGAPFRGLSSSALTGQETYWIEGAPVRYLYGGNRGIMWWLMDF